MGNIFEDIYNGQVKIDEAAALLLPEKEACRKFKKGLEKYNKNSQEEYLTQIFTHIMLGDNRFREEFLKNAGIEDFNGKFKFIAEYQFNGSKREIDVFAENSQNILIIENKIGDRIKGIQPKDYCHLCNTEKNFPVKNDKRKRYFLVLAKFSDLMPKKDWDWNGDTCIKKYLHNKMQAICKDYEFNGDYIYWHEIYDLLERYFSNEKIKADLLEFLRNQNLDQIWCRDIGSPDWRKRFIDAYNNFAEANKIEPFSARSCGRRLGPLGNNKICFVGSRVQGARSTEEAAEKNSNRELCCFLKLEIKNGKGKLDYIDLSDCCYGPIEGIIEKCEKAILDAYSK